MQRLRRSDFMSRWTAECGSQLPSLLPPTNSSSLNGSLGISGVKLSHYARSGVGPPSFVCTILFILPIPLSTFFHVFSFIDMIPFCLSLLFLVSPPSRHFPLPSSPPITYFYLLPSLAVSFFTLLVDNSELFLENLRISESAEVSRVKYPKRYDQDK